jgi:hypothetical protein
MRSTSQGHIRWAAVILCLLCVAALTRAETVLLKNGSEIVGAITSQTDTTVTVRTSYGSVTIDRLEIASIQFSTGGVQQPQPPGQPQLQQLPQPPPQQQFSQSQAEYAQGQADGERKGYEDGMREGRDEWHARMVVGVVVDVVLAVVITLAAFATHYAD